MKDSRGSKTLIKVGKAKDLEKRMRSYYTHNPMAKLIQTAELNDDFTDSNLESLCHAYFAKSGYQRVKTTEWYIIPKGMKNYFFEDIEKDLAVPGMIFKSISNYKKTPLGKKSDLLDTF
jgi:hypothetical protein